MKIERTVMIHAPAQEVYDVVMDARRLQDWVTIHQRLDDAPRGPLKEGSKLTQHLKLAGQTFKVRWTVVENDPCRRVVWEGRGPVFSHARVVYEFDTNGDGGTRFSYSNEYDLPGGPLGRIASRTVSKAAGTEVDGSLDRLKRMVE